MGAAWSSGRRGDGDGIELSREDTELAEEMFAALGAGGGVNVLVLDRDLRVWRLRWDARRVGGLVVRRGQRMQDLLDPADRKGATAMLEEVIATGRAVATTEGPTRQLRTPTGLVPVRLAVWWSPHGVFVAVTDYREQAAREARQHLLDASVVSVGSTLNPWRTANELVEVMVEHFCDLAVVNLAAEISEGIDPPLRTLGGDLRLIRAARAPADYPWPDGYLGPGDILPTFSATEMVTQFQVGEPSWLAGRDLINAVVENDPDMVRMLVPAGPNSPPAGGELTMLQASPAGDRRPRTRPRRDHLRLDGILVVRPPGGQ